MIRAALALAAAALLGMGVLACGGSSGARTATNAAASGHPSKPDRDDDKDNNDDDNHVLYYGHAANPTDRQAIVALLTRYYAAAAASDGAKACPLLLRFVSESVAEDIGHAATLRGRSCAAVMSKLFGVHHKLLSGENATLKVLTVRVEGDKALTVLSFANLPEVRQMTERREGHGWKILTLLDGILE